ncbi:MULTISPECIES: zinc-ribbon domain-containing protein [Enterocloster]|uniref:zinc-ribbon domain-containing protein n=1 Tax=Enterocloster TaxID=2719313 RepID=UPI000D1B5A05|nr:MULTISPECIES: zinc-ribbon domain-containing protein [Enterocloster]PST32100.1 hypothetical protein C7256_16665 [Enterocloster lavalensis]
MFCGECGKEIETGSRFCGYCGAAVEQPEGAACLICGSLPVREGQEFCDQCGFRLPKPVQKTEFGIKGPEGKNILGYCYATGTGGMEYNPQKARECFEDAAEQGYAPAQYNLASYYVQGLGGLERDEYRAELWMKRAADQKLSQAVKAMNLYFTGSGTVSYGVEGLLPMVGAGRRGLKKITSRIYQWELLK